MTRRKIAFLTIGLTLGICVLVYLLFFNQRSEAAINGMPQDVLGFFDVQKTNVFSAMVSTEPAMEVLEEIQLFASLKHELALFYTICGTEVKLLSDLQYQNFLAGAFSSGDQKVTYLFLLQTNEASRINLKQFLPVFNDESPEVSVHNFERSDIYELSYMKNNISVTVARVNGIFIFSTSSVLVENSILQLKKGDPVSENKSFKDVRNKMNTDADYSFYLNTDQLSNYFSSFTTNEKDQDVMLLKNFVSWLGFEFEFTKTGIKLTGYASSQSENGNLKLSNYTGEFSTDMHPAVPANTVMLHRINAEKLSENLASQFNTESLNREFFDQWMPWMKNEIIVGVSESLNAKFINKTFLIIPANDKLLAENNLKYAVLNDTLQYKGVNILEIKSAIIKGIAGVAFPEICYAAWYENDLLIAGNTLQIKNMLDAIQTGETLRMDESYNEFKSELSASFNSSIYLDLGRAEQIIKGYVSDIHIDSIDKKMFLLQKFPKLEIQFSNNKNIYLVNGFLSFTQDPQRKTGALWKLQLDHPVESGPYTVFNQINKQKNILVQDTAHQLYLISANGDVLWKLQLEDKIGGEMHEVDFYGNNKSQILFNTEHAIYLLDMLGNAVEGFPITFTTKITNPVTVLMNTKNDYRMFVACENDNIYGYYKDGKPIPGWNPQRNTGSVEKQLFTLDDDKFIGFINSKSIQIRKEAGNSVRQLNLRNPVIATYYSDKFSYFMDAKGTIIQLDNSLNNKNLDGAETFLSGEFAKVNADDTVDILLLEDQYFKAKTISGKSIFVAEFEAESPTIVTSSFQGKDYYGIISSNNKLFLFTETGAVMDGFPMDASASFVIDDVTLNGDKMLITFVNNTVMTYRIK